MQGPDFRIIRAARLELQKQAGIPANLAAEGTIGLGKGLLSGVQGGAKRVTGYVIDHPIRAGMMGLGAYGLWRILSEMTTAARGHNDYGQYGPPPGPMGQGTF